MATRPPPNLHDIFINRGPQTQSDVAYSNLLDDRDPTEARQARQVSRDLGVPAPSIEADLPGFKQEADNNRNLDLLGSNPSMARFLVDPHNAAAVKDDLPALSDISAIFNRADAPLTNYMRNMRMGGRPRLLSSTGNYSFGNIQRGAIADAFPNGRALYRPYTPPPLKLTDLIKGLDATITSTAANAGRGAEEFLADAIGLGDQYRNTQYFKDISATAQRDTDIANKPNEEIKSYIGRQMYAATQSMAIMGAAIASGSPLMAMSGAQGAPQYATVRERGGSANEALFSAVGSGAAEGVFERYFGLGWMLGNFGKKATGKFLGGLLLREVPSEVATTAVQDFFDAMTTGGGGWEGYKQRLPQDLLDTAVSTALMVGAVGGIHKVHSMVAPERRAVDDIEQAAVGAEFLDNLMTAAEKSKVRKEDPQTLQDFIDQRTEDSPVRNVYLPVEVAAEYMQSDNYKGELDRYQDQIAQAQATQGDIVIPIGEAVAHLSGTEAWTALKDKVRVQPGGLSAAEATKQHVEIMGQLEARGKEIAAQAGEAEEQRAGATEVYTDVKNRLRVAGLSDKEADNVAQLYAARYEARAAQRGGTPMEQFKRSKIVFPGESTDGKIKGRKFAQGATVNIGLDVNDGSKLEVQDVVKALSTAGVTVQNSAVQQSGTEPTFVAQLDRALTPKEAHQLSVTLKQDAIAQHSATGGALYGPAAEKWGPFDPAQFLTLNRIALEERVSKQDVMPTAGWTQERVSGLIDTFGEEDGSSSAVAVMMSPDEFLGMTASAAGRERIAERAAALGELDPAILASSQPITLTVAMGGEKDTRPPPMIRGHEGRHRMTLLKEAGVARVPVVVQLTDKDGKKFKTKQPIRVSNIVPNRSRSDQLANGDLTGEINGVPISWRYQDRLSDMGDRVLFQGEGPRGTTIITNDNQRIIQLFATANRSTMLHETGHIWLEELRDDATAKDATDQDKADWERVKKWFAANGAPMPAKSDLIPTAAHEMWARGVERYLMEGKAPTLGLRSVFRTFRAWLVRIYGVVQNLNTPITPEIREVMDRLIATQDALDDAARQNATEPLFKSAQEAGMTDAEFADYQQRIADARDEAYDALLYKTMETIRRQRTQEVRDQRASIRAEAGSAIARQPQFRLLHLLRTGKWLGEPDRPAQDVKLNTGWLIDNFGEDVLGKLPKGLPITKGDGETGDVIAEMVGLGSGSEVVHTLMGMRAASDALRARGETRSMRDVLVAEETDRLMAEQHGDVLDDGSIEEEAIAAINSARQGEIIASEARQLAKRNTVLGTPTPYQFAREWARRTVAAGHVRDVASRSALQRYIRASNKSARAAEEAILAGDIDEAYRQKQAQLLNHALLAEAKAAADRIDKIVARMKKLAGRAGMKSVDPDYMSKIHMLLEDYDFRPRSQRSIDEQEGFQEWLERQRAMGFEVHIPPRLENNGTPYTRVSVQELDSLSDLVESLIALGRTKQKIKVAQAERDFSEFRDEVVARIKQLPDRKTSKERFWKSGKLVKNSPINERERKLAAGAAELLKVETIAEELDGGPTGPLHDAIVLGATIAENKRFDLRAKVLLPLAQMYRNMGRKQRARLQERVTIPELTWNTLNEGDPRTGQTVTMTRSELMSVLMNMGNLSNLEKLSKGERWPIETLRAVRDREMTKEDFDFAQKMWDQMGLLWPDIVATEREQAGVVPEQVVSSPIETKFGTYAGGYWPVVYDPARWQLAEDMEGKQLDDMFGIKSGVATQKGHTIPRTGAFGPIQLSLENVLFSHIEQVVTRVAYASYARDVLRIVRDRTIRGWMDTKLGPEYRKQFEKWLGRQVHEGATHAKAARWWDGVMRQARVNMTIAAMGFRISTGIAQTLGLTASAQRIGAKWVGIGMKRLALSPREMPAFVYARSPEMLHRTEAVNREVSEVARKMRGKHGSLTEAQHWAMWHIGMMDRYTVALPTWIGAHAKGMSEGMTDAEASAYADKSVRQSQGSGREKDLSAIQSPNSEAMRFFTMFYTPWNVMFNAQWQGVRGLKQGNVRPMIGVTWWWMTVSMLGDAMLSGDWPEDKDSAIDWLEWAGRNMFFGLFAGIPILRDGANYAESKIIGQFASEVGTTPFTRISDAIEKSIKMGKKLHDHKPVERAIKQVGDLTSILFGVPVSQIGTSAQFAWDVAHGKQHPETISDWYFGITRDKKPTKDEEAAQ